MAHVRNITYVGVLASVVLILVLIAYSWWPGLYPPFLGGGDGYIAVEREVYEAPDLLVATDAHLVGGDLYVVGIPSTVEGAADRVVVLRLSGSDVDRVYLDISGLLDGLPSYGLGSPLLYMDHVVVPISLSDGLGNMHVIGLFSLDGELLSKVFLGGGSSLDIRVIGDYLVASVDGNMSILGLDDGLHVLTSIYFGSGMVEAYPAGDGIVAIHRGPRGTTVYYVDMDGKRLLMEMGRVAYLTVMGDYLVAVSVYGGESYLTIYRLMGMERVFEHRLPMEVANFLGLALHDGRLYFTVSYKDGSFETGYVDVEDGEIGVLEGLEEDVFYTYGAILGGDKLLLLGYRYGETYVVVVSLPSSTVVYSEVLEGSYMVIDTLVDMDSTYLVAYDSVERGVDIVVLRI